MASSYERYLESPAALDDFAKWVTDRLGDPGDPVFASLRATWEASAVAYDAADRWLLDEAEDAAKWRAAVNAAD